MKVFFIRLAKWSLQKMLIWYCKNETQSAVAKLINESISSLDKIVTDWKS